MGPRWSRPGQKVGIDGLGQDHPGADPAALQTVAEEISLRRSHDRGGEVLAGSRTTSRSRLRDQGPKG